MMTTPTPTEWSSVGLLDEISKLDKQMNDRSFAFILGAGASITSGIPAGGSLAWGWLQEIYIRKCLTPGQNIEDWAAKELKIPTFSKTDAATHYSKIFELRFGCDLQSGYAALEEIMETAEPSVGYSILAKILANKRHKVVVTTNFDNLIADALAIHALRPPLIVGHESLAGFVRPLLSRPLVAKIHRDLHLHPKNDQEGVNNLEDGWNKALTSLFQHYTPIVIGYGGNDGSLMGLLDNLSPGHIPGRLFWCYREGERPNDSILKIVEKHNGVIVAIAGFDEFMVQLAQELFQNFKLDSLAEEINHIGTKRANRYAEQANILMETLAKNDSSSSSMTVAQARQSLSEASDDLNKWWTWVLRAQKENNLAKKLEIYEEAISKLPDSPELLGSYAFVLANQFKDFNRAESLYIRALELEPDNANITGNYANFLTNLCQDYDAAEKLYIRALDLEPNNARITGNYANFQADHRHDYNEAEKLYKRALELDPNNANITGNYAVFLADQRHDYDAAEKQYKRALELDPNNADITGNYATVLANQCQDYDAAEKLYKRALELDPNNANITGNYAVFLADQRHDYDAAEKLYKRALDLDPNHANITGNYANFLNNQRHDYDAAEKQYKRALELDPNNANITGNYASFLADQRHDYDAAEKLYKRALDLDPDNADITGNYANFLTNQRHDFDAAEKLYKRALELDPNHANNTGNYATVLANQCQDYDAAEKLYKRALELDSNNADITGNYANFLTNQRHDYDAAEKLYKRALELAPQDVNINANYVYLLLIKDNDIDFITIKNQIQQAINHSQGIPSQPLAEILFYDCILSELMDDTISKSVGRIKKLFDLEYVHGSWEFAHLYETCLTEISESKRPFYVALGDAILDSSKVTELNKFSIWNQAEPIDPFTY
jgi:Tfp pilus assembly protein PilF